MRTAVFSIISPNYRHFARVLMDSVRRHHPHWERFVLVAGGAVSAPGAEELFAEVSLDTLPLPNVRQFCFRYTLLELNTAVKPWMFEHLFTRGYDRVIFLDPDLYIYTPLAEMDELSSRSFLTLTPHLTASIPGDEHPSEHAILLAGTYNLGFLAVTRQEPLARFLRWWQEKLEFHCVSDRTQGLFVDQKWMDLTPGLFPGVAILRHEGYNVAYWNLAQRPIRGTGSEATVNGQPLRFFHFSGCDPAMPTLISKHDPKQTVAAAGDAGKVVAGYLDLLRAAGAGTYRHASYAYGRFADGSRISDGARIAYRNSTALQEACGADPFAHAKLFRMYQNAEAPLLNRVLRLARPFVRLVPTRPRHAARDLLVQWRNRGRNVPPPARARQLPAGVNIVGYFSRDTGVGESARLGAAACEEAGLLTRLVDVDSARQLSPPAAYRVTVAYVNAAQTLEVARSLPGAFDREAYRIACWHWELPELPDAWVAAASAVDEIWAPSAFVQSAISRKVTIPVVHMPHGVDVVAVEPCSPQEFGVPPGAFVFLSMFDFDSFVERKNPLAAAEAFRRAFPDPAGAVLLIKTLGASEHSHERAALEQSLRAIPGVYLMDQNLTRARMNGLLAACDAVVSLHRSEGFGLVLAEAMALGKPVVATGWSGNMDFMNSGNSCPVAYDMVALQRDHGPYRAGQLWANPDVDHAAHCMRRVFGDDAWRTQLGARARQTISSQFSPAAAGARYRQRLGFLGLLR